MLVATQMRLLLHSTSTTRPLRRPVALVHSRYSTNTMPSWERAHPNRFIIHNGEINTLKGNVNWIRAREPNLYSPVLQHDLERVMPIINREGSDSAILDNVLEFLGHERSSAYACRVHVTARAVGPQRQPERGAPRLRRLPVHAHGAVGMGPAAIAFTDGRTLGAASTVTACAPPATM